MKEVESKEVVVILHDIRSIENVGAIFRTAEGAGVSKMYLTGYTPGPVDRFGRERKALSKTALGAEKMVLWECAESPYDLVEKLKAGGFTVVAVEQSPTSVDYRTFTLPSRAALIFGNEVEGVPQELLSLCSATVEIPLYGKKESLNVSVAAGVALFRLLRP